MRNSLNNAKEEFKRCDHLLYVSLKYTRTVDVIKSLIARMLSTYGFAIDALLLKEKKKVKELPPQVGVKIDLARKIFAENKIVIDNLDSFTFLRKLDKAPYKRENEYRRHVALIAKVDGEEKRIEIDQMTEHYFQLKEFLEYLEEQL